MDKINAPVTDPDRFFGRKNIVRRIFSRIGAARPQSVAVIGGRQSGKSSLLNHLADETVRRDNLPEASRYVFVSLPGPDDPGLDAAAFLDRLCDRLEATARPGENGYNRLQGKVEELHRAGKHLVCFFDDFHRITRNTNFPLEFFSFLRSLANNFNLAYVTSSYLELQKLCVAKDIEESPFFNIFTNIALGLMEPDEARSLLKALTGWPDAEVKRAAAWAGAFPYVLKLVAAACPDGPPEESRYEKDLLPRLKSYFDGVLGILPREAFKPLKALVKGKPADPRDAHYLKPLVRHHFLLEEDESISFFSEAFRIFTQKHASPDLLKGTGCTG
jgi:hypothetical protein